MNGRPATDRDATLAAADFAPPLGRPGRGDPFERLAALPRGRPAALLHGGGVGPTWLFASPVDVLEIEDEPARLGPATFAAIDAFLHRHCDRAVVGWLGYDLRDAVEPLPRSLAADLGVPVVHLAAHDAVERWDAVRPPASARVAARGAELVAHVARADYERRVARVVEHIRAGDIFQANLTWPFTARHGGDPRALFARLCAASPAPFGAWIETATGLAVASASPEELLRRDGSQVRCRPIKGTRPRAADPGRDAALAAELAVSDKDLAELAMIVDLVRNDLGKVARIGSVTVGPFPERRSFAQVHHLFATIAAELRDGVSTGDLLAALLPFGSITGAPKLRCMEILEDLEVARRGVYTGAIGWFGPGARAHLAVAIRTLTLTPDGRIRGNVGGGVTAASDPAAEYEETLDKAAGMLAALGLDRADLARAGAG